MPRIPEFSENFESWLKRLNTLMLSGFEEESVVIAAVANCSCLTCCDGEGEFYCAVSLDNLCYCNQRCRTASDINCCNNVTICDSETITATFPE